MAVMSETEQLCYNCFQSYAGGETCPYCGFDPVQNAEKYPIALPVGTVLNGRYIVGRVLGQGGFGITYLALDTQLNARVAVKEFLPSEIASRIQETTVSVVSGDKADEFAYGAERFQEEARTLAKFIGHPNIAGVSSYFDENGTSYFVMDYIEGVSFKSYIANQGGRVSVQETLDVMIPVLRALTAVHQEGFIHRDVTPDNIYISKDGNVKLLDFGSARYSIGDKSKSLDVILKVGYAPKEQYIRRGRQGPYTDVYSCAACMYAAITGYLPPESLERLDKDDIVSITDSGIEIPAWLDYAIMKGLAVQPEDRFQSAEEFLRAIEEQSMTEAAVPAAVAAEKAAAATAKKNNTKMIAGIAAACLAVAVGAVALLGGESKPAASGSGSTSGPPLIKSEVPSITIAGQEYSTDLRNLSLNDMGLTDADIEPLKYMVNLQSLKLQKNNITDISCLEGLTQLRELRLRENDITDLSPLAGMTEMMYLNLAENTNISDLSPLAGMTKMKELNLPFKNTISDLSPLSGMTELEYLGMDGYWGTGNTISDLSPLENLTNLKQLALGVDQVEDLKPLAGLHKLQELTLYGEMNISSLNALSGLTSLKTLRLSTNTGNSTCVFVEDLSGLSNLTQMETLELFCSGLKSFKGLEGMTSLKKLQMYVDSGLQDISALKGLTAMEELNIWTSNSNNPWLKDLDAFSNMTRLQTLQFSADGLENLDGIANLTNLQTLRFYGNDATYSNVNALSKLTKVKELYLPGTKDDQMVDFSGIENMTELTSFSASAGVKSYQPFGKLTKLKTLNLYAYYPNGSRPADLEALGNLSQLTSLRISLGDGETDITALGKLTNLRELNLYDYSLKNGLQDISPLGNLTNLQTLSLSARNVRDISPLANLRNLKSVEIRKYKDNQFTDLSPLDHVPSVTIN